MAWERKREIPMAPPRAAERGYRALPGSLGHTAYVPEIVRIDGIAMEHGDGKTPSDLYRLLSQLYGWLAEPARAAGFGGYERSQGLDLPEGSGRQDL